MTSKQIYGEFTPTYLYIKQHSVTGLMYFGKTVQKDPIKYLGSGTYWKLHLDKHGTEYVVTLWHELFANKDELTEFALHFSQSMSIVKSNQWANLKEENGVDGGGIHGYTHSIETKNIISQKLQGRKRTELTRSRIRASKSNVSVETRMKMRNSHVGMTGKSHSTETLLKMRKPKRKKVCPHCNREVGSIRYHFENCKLKES